MICRTISKVLTLLGIYLLCLAGYYMSIHSPDSPATIVPEPEVQLAAAVSGQDQPVSFQIQNRSRRPLRIVGLEEC